MLFRVLGWIALGLAALLAVAVAGLSYLKRNGGNLPGNKFARRAIILVIGVTVVLIGVALLVLPGPGIPAIIIGLAVLSTEFVWARRLLRTVKQAAEKMGQKVGVTTEAPPQNAGWYRRLLHRFACFSAWASDKSGAKTMLAKLDAPQK